LITDFEFPGGLQVRKALRAVAPALGRLLQRARTQRIPVIYVNDNPGRWRSDAPALIRRCKTARRALPEFDPLLMPRSKDFILLKPRHSGFYGTPLEPLLQDLRVDTLIVVGISTESCVWMTACDAYTRGFDLIVPTDTAAGLSAKAVAATLTGLKTALGVRTPATSASVKVRGGYIA
jgi:nicotinamidase-related amidase